MKTKNIEKPVMVRKRGRKPGPFGRYIDAEQRKEQYMIRLKKWLLDELKARAKKEGKSVSGLIEEALIEKKIRELWEPGMQAGIKP
jgi:hypothetical protein